MHRHSRDAEENPGTIWLIFESGRESDILNCASFVVSMPGKMSLECAKADDAYSSFDEACWESARSSWIYMEMEPRPRGCCSDYSFSASPESGGRRAHAGRSSDEVSIIVSTCDTSRCSDSMDSSLEFIENLTFEREEEDYEDHEHFYTGRDELRNDNFILRGDHRLKSSVSLLEPDRKTTSAGASVCLESYSSNSCDNQLGSQRESVAFPGFTEGLRPHTGVTQVFPRYHQWSPASQLCVSNWTSPSSNYLSINRADFDADNQSMTSVSTMATMSTTGSCNSLYRVPSKLRKLSSPSISGSSPWTTISAKNTHSVEHTQFETEHVSLLLPKFLRDTVSFLWCDNPDHDPFNTFSVSETDLTSAIAHLEQQLSGSGSNLDNEETRQDISGSDFEQKSLSSTLSKFRGHSFSESCRTMPGNDVSEDDDDEHLHSLPFRVQFIMESYCSIYMKR